MSESKDTVYGMTKEDISKLEQKEAKAHGGQISKDSDAAILKQIYAENTENPQEKIDRVKANLPLPDDPPTASDWQSADGRTVNVGSGGVNVKLGTQSSSGLREPATADSAARIDGEEWKKPTV